MFSQACLAERERRGKERGFLLRGRVGPWEHLAGKSTWGGQGQRGRMIGIDVQNQSSDCQSQSSKRNAIEKKKKEESEMSFLRFRLLRGSILVTDTNCERR